MLQQRALTKYHSAGLWTNTCCGHPKPGEDTLAASHRRLREEMGFDCKLEEAFSFTYKAPFENGLIEHEFDHVFIGKYDKEPVLNPEEANACKWISLPDLQKDITEHPELYTIWLKICFEKVLEFLKK